MRSVLLCILAFWFCVIGVADASAGRAGHLAKEGSGNAGGCAKGGPSVETLSCAHKKVTHRSNRLLLLDQALPTAQEGAPAVETIKSLANGAAPLNPWFPERGAIGVRVKVAW